MPLEGDADSPLVKYTLLDLTADENASPLRTHTVQGKLFWARIVQDTVVVADFAAPYKDTIFTRYDAKTGERLGDITSSVRYQHDVVITPDLQLIVAYQNRLEQLTVLDLETGGKWDVHLGLPHSTRYMLVSKDRNRVIVFDDPDRYPGALVFDLHQLVDLEPCEY